MEAQRFCVSIFFLVPFHAVDAHAEAFTDLSVGQAFPDKQENLPAARRKAERGRVMFRHGFVPAHNVTDAVRVEFLSDVVKMIAKRAFGDEQFSYDGFWCPNLAPAIQRFPVPVLGHDETPFGVHYSDRKPDGFGPKAGEILCREREAAGQIDWQKVFGNFSCITGNILLARKKKKAAWISREEYGCPGGLFYSGVDAPYLEFIPHYVSTGIPGHFDGEHYMASPEAMRAFLEDTAPPAPTGKYCVMKPLDQFTPEETPLAVTFFARPEVLTGLHTLAVYTAGHHHVVVSPFGPTCGIVIAWPLAYQQRGEERAVLGGFDPSARKFLKTDELVFSVSLNLYHKMLDAMETSLLTRHTWEGVRKKVLRSGRAWGASVMDA
jgi:hypothetical protein